MSTLLLNPFIVKVSLAKALAAGETQALALDLTDNFWQPSTGHYGSAYVLDTGTPANNYDSHPHGLKVGGDAIPYTGAPPTGVDITTEHIALRSAAFGSGFTEITVIATFLDAGVTFKGGVTISAAAGTLTAWNGVVGASVPGGLSGACRLVRTIVLPRGMSSTELIQATT